MLPYKKQEIFLKYPEIKNSVYPDSNVNTCNGLVCRKDLNSVCQLSFGNGAAEGTPCGSGMVCQFFL